MSITVWQLLFVIGTHIAAAGAGAWFGFHSGAEMMRRYHDGR